MNGLEDIAEVEETTSPHPDKAVQPEQPVAMPPTPKLVVWFDYAQGEIRNKSRVFLNGVRDLYSQADVEAVEALIKQSFPYESVFVTNWRHLEF